MTDSLDIHNIWRESLAAPVDDKSGTNVEKTYRSIDQATYMTFDVEHHPLRILLRSNSPEVEAATGTLALDKSPASMSQDRTFVDDMEISRQRQESKEQGDETICDEPEAKEQSDETICDELERVGKLKKSEAVVIHQNADSEFSLQEEIGRGGVGVVFRAEQRSLNREVAIKKLKTRGASPGRIRQFIAEAHITGELNHPNIVPIYDLGQNNTGEVLLAMKLIDGLEWKESLAVISEEELAVDYLEKNLEILLNVCNAVAFAHSRNIVHLDLKPSNVMIGAFGEVLVMDWGLAVDIRPIPSSKRISLINHKSSVTSPRGTPAFMPPELAKGLGHELGPWTDTYLLGAILYMILSGRGLHQGVNFADVLVAACESAPPTFDKAVPEELQAICCKAVAKNITDRYQEVRTLQDDLRSFLRHSQSKKISKQANELLQLCLARTQSLSSGGELHFSATEAVDLYFNFSEVVAGFRQASLLWPENHEAMEGELKARLAMARGALKNGDFVLVEAQLKQISENNEESKDIREALLVAKNKRAHEKATAAKLQRTILATVVMTLIGLSLGLYFVNKEQRATAIAHEETAKAKAVVDNQFAEILRLSDLKRLEKLEQEQDQLWPATSVQIRPLEKWLEKAKDIVLRRVEHIKTLNDLRKKGQPTDKVDQWQFQSFEQQWAHDTLKDLIRKLEKFERQRIDEVQKRLGFARIIRKRSIVDHQEEWNKARASIAKLTVYNGLKIDEIEGWIPLGQDPKSSLWEFVDIQSGAPPERDSNGQLVIKNGTALIFVLIPAGQFTIGATAEWGKGSTNVDPNARVDESPSHKVTLAAFYLAKYEVTQDQWLRRTGETPSQYGPRIKTGARHPVTNVNYQECVRELFRLGLKLPTEAQWEYAARAGTTSPWWTGEKKRSLIGYANIADRGYRTRRLGRAGFEDWNDGYTLHAPVGAFKANAFGLHDMTGNVWEWCRDAYGSYHNPVAAKTGERLVKSFDKQVMRGGGWDNDASWQRVAFRHTLAREARYSGLGVRPVREIDSHAERHGD
jgi:formylglycine-generating enzyme required for sulfatase activity/serine/threonine protein kinase